MTTISASVARQSLPAQLDRVEAGEEVLITRHGRVVAVLIRPDLLAARRAVAAWAEADKIADLLEEGRRRSGPRGSIPPERADELVRAVRGARDAR